MSKSRKDRSRWQRFISMVGVISACAILTLALAGCGDSGGSGLTLPTSSTSVPSAVTVAAVDSGSATVTWSSVPDAQSYNLHMGTTPDFTPTAANKVANVTGTSYTSTGLDYMKTYYFKICAVFAHGEGMASSAGQCRLPPVPPDFISITAGSTALVLKWTDVPGATSYNIYRGTSPGVKKGTAATKKTNVTSPYIDTEVTTGTTLYYVVTAVSDAGESIESLEVGALVTDTTLGVPLNVNASLTAETTLSVTVSWTEPLTGTAPTSYNIYRSTTTPVAISATTLLGSVPALPGQLMQYIDTKSLVGGTTYHYVVTSVAGSSESLPSAEVSATPRGPRNSTGGGETDTGFGNNLAAPIIFANPFGITGLPISGTWTLDPKAIDFNTGLRPLSTEASLATITTLPYFDPATTLTLNNVTYYKQASASTWQGEWKVATEPVHVTAKWGDTLTSRTVSASSSARVEMVLTNTFANMSTTMTGYTMKSLYGSRTTEVTGCDGTSYQSSTATVFPANGRLKIEKLDGPGGNPVWVYLDKAVYERFGVDGRTSGMAGEIGVGGGLALGYNWLLAQLTMPAGIEKTGTWRLTFSLDPTFTIGTASGLLNNVIIDAATNGKLDSASQVSIEVTVGSSGTTGGSGGSGSGGGSGR